MLIFFFKQKTAYEMRISDWSSDVCSSDLREQPERPFPTHHDEDQPRSSAAAEAARVGARSGDPARGIRGRPQGLEQQLEEARPHPQGDSFRVLFPGRLRSEEHTSDLQSLLRISYAVFCLKKKSLKSHRAPTTSFAH